MLPFLLALHAFAAIVWVGGMFFALLVLRPALVALPGPDRLRVWRGTLPLFFRWVWAAIAILLVTGYVVVFDGYGGFAGAGLHIHIMNGTGLLMIALFLLLNFVPYRRFKTAFDAGDMAGAAAAMGQIRLIVIVNLVLGLITAAVGGTGALWG